MPALIGELGQRVRVDLLFEWHDPEHFLAAVDGGQMMGFSSYVVQGIGPEKDRSAPELNDQLLREAEILASGVPPRHRHQGIEQALEQRLIRGARVQGLAQVRLHSGDVTGADFVRPLQTGEMQP